MDRRVVTTRHDMSHTVIIWHGGGTRMLSVEALSRLALRIYAAALDNSEWSPVVSEISQALGADGGALIVTESPRRRIPLYHNVPPAAETSYRSYYNSIDHVLAAVECGPAGLVRTGEELIDPRGGSEFNSDFMRPHCMQDGLFVRLAAPGRPTTLLVVSARATHSFATEERTRLLSALVPHLQQALHAESVLAQTVRQTRILEDVLNVDDRGVVVVSAEGAVWSANAAASEIFTVDDGISVRGGRIVTDALRGSIAMALSAGSDGLRRGSWIRCPRPSGKEPYVANVVPIGDPTGPDHRALVVLNDPAGHKDQSAEEIVRDLYGLTPTETRFVALLRDGNSLADVADRLSVSLTTVRTHLQHVFRKTGTHRQTELVRLLLSVDGRP